MGYQLTITAGLGEGKSFTFDQNETRIGRTSDNDVVLFDPGVSRRHARIFEKDGAYFAEDLGSANGTKVNGNVIAQATALNSGDTVGVGPVIFAFEALGLPEVGGVAGQETRIVNRATVAPSDVSPEELAAQDLRSTRAVSNAKLKEALAAHPAHQAATAAAVEKAPVRRPGDSRPAREERAVDEDVGDDQTAKKRPPRAGTGAAAALSTRGADRPVRRSEEGGAGLSAAERARARREYGDSLGGQLRYQWAQMSGRARGISIAVAAAVVLGTFGGLGYLFMPKDGSRGPTGPEPGKLSLKPVEDSFGLGEGVTWERPDIKAFDFEFNTPTAAVVVLHYQAQDISEGEVSIAVNGIEQGFVPADIAGQLDRELEQVLAPRALKRNDRNQLIFDNVRNPPGEDPWQVSRLWIEVVPIPDLSTEETVRSAQDYANKAGQFFEQREVGSENLFRAWKNYRYAWINLESLEAKPELYETVRFQMNSLKRELDSLCSRLMLDAQRAIQLKDRKRAKQTLEDVPRHFPTTEHRCHNLARQKLVEYDL